MKKVLFYGIGSYKNRGVEAIVQSSLNLLPKDIKVDIASYDIDYNKERYNERVNNYINHRTTYEELSTETREIINKYANNKNFFEIEKIYQKDIIDKLSEYDVCFSAGGDNYCYDANDWLFTIDKCVKNNNKKLVLFGASLYEKIENEDLIRDLDLFDVLSIRESISYNALKKYIPEKKLLLIPDSAFSLEPEEVKMDSWYNNREVVGINISPIVLKECDNENHIESAIELIDYIINKTKYSVSLITHVTVEQSNDYDVLSKIYEKFKDNKKVFLEKPDYNCNQIKYIISKCKLMIAARTHASIAAYSSCIPTLVLGYSVKSKGIAKDLFGTSDNYVIPFEQFKTDNLIDKFNWLNKNQNKIKEKLDGIIPKMKDESLHVFEKIFELIEKQNKNEICNEKECINCNLCKKVCPVNAIKTVEADLHFKYNKRDLDKCINCGKCIKICPVLNNNQKEKYNNVSYAAKNKNLEIQKTSTSGGVFTVFAEYILNKKGIVYGAERINNNTQHIRVTNKKELNKIRGSKYSYSKMDNILDSLKEDIKSNKLILFSGTPCQVNAIKRFAEDYKKIYYISVICHGVLNDELVNEYCNYSNLKLLDFRTKENGWSKSSVKYDKYINTFADDNLLSLYVNNIILRESCYNCKFTIENNIADVIIGDFWGVKEKCNEMFDENGVSIVITNSTKGKELFNNIKDELIIKKVSSDILNEIHPNLFKSPVKPIERFTINEDLKNNSWEFIHKMNKYKNRIKELEQETDNLRGIIYNKNVEIDSIMNSKRWKLINKVGNVLHKFTK